MGKLKLRYRKGKGLNLYKVFNASVKGYKRAKEMERKKNPEILSSGDIVKILRGAGIENEKPEERKTEDVKGIEITASEERRAKKTEEGQQKISVTYPLIPSHPLPGQEVFASASIRWSPRESALVYLVSEPPLSEKEKILLEQIKASLIEKLDVDFTKLRRGEAKEYLERQFSETVSLMSGELPQEKRRHLLYYVERDFIGLGKIEPLMHDPNIEDISCDGVRIPIFIYHRNGRIGTVRTNISYSSPEEIDSFLNKLAQRSGKTISVAEPLLDSSLPDGSRIQLTLGTDIAKRGSNFTIRKFTDIPLSPVDMMKFGTVDPKILSYLWLITEHGKSTLIGGGTATGKTTLLNALSLFIKPELKIVTIEDTAELRLPHSHWVPQVARQPMAELGGRKIGEVDMFDLLRESLRQRPDFIIVGEVRGKEAYVLFQQIATGHAGMATIHADTMEKLVDRLTTPPIELPPSLLENLDVIIFLVRIKVGNKYVRRASAIFEVTGFDRERNAPLTNMIFKWDPVADRFETANPSILLKKISDASGASETSVQKDIGRRIKVMNWLLEKDYSDYRIFAKVMKLYYTEQDRLFEMIEKG